MSNFNNPPKLEGYCYSGEEAREARDKGELRSVRTELSLKCNLRCSYCCNRSGDPLPDEIKFEKVIDVVDQAKDLNSKSVVIIGGGEPTIYPKFRELVEHVDSLKMVPVIFTNTQTMTRELAEFLYEHNVSVIIKLDSLDPEIQDAMVGVRGAYENIMQGLSNLQGVGYSGIQDPKRLKLGASFVVNKQNVAGIPDVWKFCRDHKIFPNLEMMIPNGQAKNSQYILTQAEWRTLKTQLLEIDQREYGYNWLPYTPLAGAGCFQPMYNLYITASGDVRPCSSIHVKNAANIRSQTLRQIMELPFFVRARNVDKHLKGKCGKCNNHAKCIGCRGLAYATETNKGTEPLNALCAPDPSCWR
jgi:radical SAM protein with 4Fe4S-binding SPASM domain